MGRLRDLVTVVEHLRSAEGCPWDREQTNRSLRATLLEEAYEVLEAIDAGSVDGLKEELGDVLLQVLMQATIAEQAGEFDLADVAAEIRAKLVRRHPHVFGDLVVPGAEQVVRNWEALKAAEYKRESVLDGVQRSLPALQWAWSLQRRAAMVGFDWPDVAGVRAKVLEELGELDRARTPEERESELGDLLFALANLSRHMGINPEDALRHATGRFEARFRMMETRARAEGRSLAEMTLQELDARWGAAKAQA